MTGISAAGTTMFAAMHHPPGVWGYRSYREHLAERFPGRRIRKLCLHAGFTCPNLDGSRGKGGCAYCDNRAFAPGVRDPMTVAADLHGQWDRGRAFLRRRHRRVDGFIAYFQSFSNTYAPVEQLQSLYEPVTDSFPECVGLSLGTRPDCLPDPVVEYLQDLGRRTWLTVEIGLQSDDDQVLNTLNRGHDRACFLDAVARCAGKGFELCVHVILGLPGEGEDAPERMGNLLAALPISSLKIHNLHVVKGTAWAHHLAEGRLSLPGRDDYLGSVRRLLACLRPDQSVQRLLADAPDHLLLSDPWCQDKQRFLNDLKSSL